MRSLCIIEKQDLPFVRVLETHSPLYATTQRERSSFMQKVYKVYKITNLINGKIYIGRTERNLNQRFSGHVSGAKSGKRECYFARAIRKYGAKNFKIELIETNLTLEENKLRERYYISLFESDKKGKGYNLENGKWENKKRSYNKQYRKNKARKAQKRPPKTGRKGVKFSKRHGKYMATISGGFNPFSQTRKIYSRLFSKEADAFEFYDRMALYLHGKNAFINIETKRKEYLKKNNKKGNDILNKVKSSKYRGVRIKKNGKFNTVLCINKRDYTLGTFVNESCAAEEYDKFSYLIYKRKDKLNFPNKIKTYLKNEKETKQKWTIISDSHRICSINNTSGFRGIYQYKAKKQKKTWVARFRKDFLGFFLTKEEAAKVYDKKAFEILGNKAKLNFPNDYIKADSTPVSPCNSPTTTKPYLNNAVL